MLGKMRQYFERDLEVGRPVSRMAAVNVLGQSEISGEGALHTRSHLVVERYLSGASCILTGVLLEYVGDE